MITAFIVIGAVLMVWNIYRFFTFIRSTQDVLSADSTRDQRWMSLAFVLLVFFLCGYLYVEVIPYGKPPGVYPAIKAKFPSWSISHTAS